MQSERSPISTAPLKGGAYSLGRSRFISPIEPSHRSQADDRCRRDLEPTCARSGRDQKGEAFELSPLTHSNDAPVSVGMIASDLISDARVDVLLELLELARWKRVTREGAQRFCAVKFDARVVEGALAVISVEVRKIKAAALMGFFRWSP